jgi:hypothetical protein
MIKKTSVATLLVLTLFLTSYAQQKEKPNISGIYPHLAFYNNEGECEQEL